MDSTLFKDLQTVNEQYVSNITCVLVDGHFLSNQFKKWVSEWSTQEVHLRSTVYFQSIKMGLEKVIHPFNTLCN